MSVEFEEWPKIARLSRDIIISEKIDGTNSSIFISDIHLEPTYKGFTYESNTYVNDSNVIATFKNSDGIPKYTMRAGSRTKWIFPGKQSDNEGFARWALNNAEELFKLGEGHHFGEWWGSGIKRGYNLPKGEKRFSLFNISRWGIGGKDETSKPNCCHVVPILYTGPFETLEIEIALYMLKHSGSEASPGFMNPEGVIVWHTAANIGFKKTIKNDEIPKSLQK